MRHLALILVALVAPIPARASAEVSAAEALMEAGHWKRARSLLETPNRAPADGAANAYLLSRVRLAFGDLDAALAQAERAVSLDGGSARYHFQLARVCGELAERSGAFRQLALARRFKREAEAAVALDAAYLEARVGLMEYYLQAPRILGGDRKKAAQMAETIAGLDPSEGYLARRGLLRDGATGGEEEALDLKAAESNPRSYEIRMILSDFYASDSIRRYDLSEKQDRVALQIDPGRIGAYAALAAQYARQERWSDLDQILAAAERSVPDDRSPLYRAADALLSTGRGLPRAERYLRAYVTQEPEALAPRLPLAHLRLGLLLERLGRRDEAIAELETARRLDPDLKEAGTELGRLR